MAKNTPRVQICTPGANLHPGANCAHERGLTQFRVSAHRLEIESGRYKKNTVSERIYKFFNLNTVEDEVHFLCNCSAYHNERQLFFKYIVDSAPSFRTLDGSAKLIWLMTCEDDIVINALADFIYKGFEMRKCAIT